MSAKNPISRILSANLAVQFLGLLMTLASAWLLGVSDFGALTAILVWTAFLPQILNLGVPDTMISLTKNIDHIAQVYRDGLLLTFILSSFAIALLFVGGFLDAISFSFLQAVGASAIMALTMISGCVASLEQRLSNFGAYNQLLILTNAIALALLSLAFANPTLRTVEYVLLTRAFGLLVPVTIGLLRRRDYLFGRPSNGIYKIGRKATRFHTTAFLNAFGSRSDQMISSIFLSPTQMGVLGLILPFTQAVKSVPNAISTVKLVRVVEEPDSSARIRQIASSRQRAFIAGAGAAAIATVACACVMWLQGQAQNEGVLEPKLIIPVALYMVGASLAGIIDLTIRMHRGVDLVRPGIASRSVSAVFSVGAAIYAIREFALLGASMAFLTTTLLAFLVLTISTRAEFRRKGLS